MTIDFLGQLRAQSARFGEVLAGTQPTAEVPSCPGWTAADLLWHLTEVQSFWATIVRDRLDDPEGVDAPDRPTDPQELLLCYRAASATLLDALATAPVDTPVWTWHDDDQSVGFVRRRQAHEALIHRLDAELTAGATPAAVDPELAADGVSEVLEVMYGGAPPWADEQRDGPTGRVSATDTGDEWFVQLGRFSGTSPNSGTVYADEPNLRVVAAADPSFTVTGTARDLDAWLWNRPTVAEVSADGADLHRFTALIRGGVQ